MKFPKQGRVKKTGKEFKAWHNAILERDGWTCQRCGSRRNLHVHHIIKRSILRLDTMDNGVTVCWICHDEIERGHVSCERGPEGVRFRSVGTNLEHGN